MSRLQVEQLQEVPVLTMTTVCRASPGVCHIAVSSQKMINSRDCSIQFHLKYLFFFALTYSHANTLMTSVNCILKYFPIGHFKDSRGSLILYNEHWPIIRRQLFSNAATASLCGVCVSFKCSGPQVSS